jgi:TPR repeat protein
LGTLFGKTNPLMKKKIVKGMYNHALHLSHQAQGSFDGEAIVLIRAAADSGYPPAMYQFGLYLRDKGKGSEAMAWFHKAAGIDVFFLFFFFFLFYFFNVIYS